MFCTKCGKKIDDDSRFCPYCGENVKGGSAAISSQNSTRIYYQRGIHKKFAVGLAGCIIAIISIIVFVKLFFGDKEDSIAEQLFLMSWEEISELSYSDMEERLNEENILYKTINTENSWMIKTQNTTSFMDADCLLVHGSTEVDNDTGFDPSLSAQFSVLGLACETEKGFKNVKAELETYLNKQLIEGAIVFKTGNEQGTSYLYAVEASDKNVDKFRDYIDENEREVDLEGCSIYKFVQLFFAKSDDLSYFEPNDFPSDKNYTDFMCEVTVFYTPMTQKEFIALAAAYDYDAILGKNMELDELRKSEKISLLNQKVDLDQADLRAIYFVENHGMDIRSGMDVNSDEQKKIWYISNFAYDMGADKKVDQDKWDDSAVYLAYTYNYDVEKHSCFESDLDRAKYLINNNYNPDTGELFESETETRLWAMENIGYDTKYGEMVDSELLDVLKEYQKYLERWRNREIDGIVLSAALIYLDDDDIPELVLIEEMQPAAAVPSEDTVHVIKYTPNGLCESEFECAYSEVYYVPKSGEIYGCYHEGNYYYKFFSESLNEYILRGDSLEPAETYYYSEMYDDNENVMGVEASEGLSSDFTVSDYIDSRQDFVDLNDRFVELRYYSDNALKYDIFDLYDYSAVDVYSAFWFQIETFALEDNTLTVEVNDGTEVGWEPLETFAFSCPVSDDCNWYDGYIVTLTEWRDLEETSYAELKKSIEDSMREWEEFQETDDYKEYGYGPESPPAFYFYLRNGVVCNVYRHTP